MSSNPFGGYPTLLAVIDRLQELGCKVVVLSGEIVSDDGVFVVRYAHNPDNGKFVVLPATEDHEQITPWVIGNIERRLGIITGFPRL